MRTLLFAIVACAAAAAGCDPAGPVGPAELPTARVIKVERASFETTGVCVNGSNQIEVTVTWNAQPIDPAQLLTITLVFKGRNLPASPASQVFIGPYDVQPSFAVVRLNGFIGESGLVPWGDWTSVAASASGTFEDRAAVVRQPKSGWPSC